MIREEYLKIVKIVKIGQHGRIVRRSTSHTIKKIGSYIECDKDHTVRQLDDGKVVICSRYHCARTSHFPLVWGDRIPVVQEEEDDFKVPKCPWCGEPLVKGGLPDVEGLSIHGPA